MRTAAKRRASVDPATSYALDVLAGKKYVVGRPVLWACQRHIDDLASAEGRGFYFDADAAQDAFEFFGLLRHFEGELGRGEGSPFVLEPWQQFIVGSVFGWKRRSDDTRRFRTAWVRVARKNGKSFLAAGVGNLLLTVDGEPGAQIYSAATKRDQAKIIHRAAIAQRDKSPSLRGLVTKMRDRLIVTSTRSFFAPLGADSHTEDGLNPHGATLDEIHAHRDAGMWDVIVSAMGARKQPLIFATTTAGFGAATFGRQQDAYYRSVVDPDSGVDNDAAFVYIAELDEVDDPYDERNWEKANPNIGVSVRREYLSEQAAQAKQQPRAETNFLVKNLNMWVQSEKRWIGSDTWDACKTKLSPEEFRSSLRGRPCFTGLDLSSTTDLTAFVLFFPAMAGKPAALLPFFFVPQDGVEERMKKDRVDYQTWINKGLIEATPGPSVDQDRIKSRIRELSVEFQFARHPVAMDRKFGEKLAVELEAEGFQVRKFGQGYASYSGPTKEFERMVLAGVLEHDGNAVMRWNVGNAVLKQGDEGDVMPSKGRSPDRIDGVHAAIMAIGVAGVNPYTAPATPTFRKLSVERGGGKRPVYNVFR